MRNTKNNTPTVPNLGELQQSIDGFFVWTDGAEVRELLFDLYTMSKDSPTAKQLDAKENATQALLIKELGRFVSAIEAYTSVPRT